MEIKAALLLRRSPLVRYASTCDTTGEQEIAAVLTEVVNFARAGRGEAHMIIGTSVRPEEDEPDARATVEALIKALATHEGELSALVENFHTDRQGVAYLKVTITAK